MQLANGKVNQIPETLHEMYIRDFDMSRLATHLNMLPDIVKQYSNTSDTKLQLLEVCVL